MDSTELAVAAAEDFLLELARQDKSFRALFLAAVEAELERRGEAD